MQFHSTGEGDLAARDSLLRPSAEEYGERRHEKKEKEIAPWQKEMKVRHEGKEGFKTAMGEAENKEPPSASQRRRQRLGRHLRGVEGGGGGHVKRLSFQVLPFPEESESITEHRRLLVHKEGWLVKKAGVMFKTWEQRYFRLHLNRLHYYKRQPASSDVKPRHTINLDDATCKRCRSPAPSEWCFEIVTSDKRVYQMYAADETEMLDWMEAIQRASSLFLQLPYAQIATRNGKKIAEYTLSHWSHHTRRFREYASIVVSALAGNDKELKQHHTYQDLSCFFITDEDGEHVFIAITDHRMVANKAFAFVKDIRHRYQQLQRQREEKKEQQHGQEDNNDDNSDHDDNDDDLTENSFLPQATDEDRERVTMEWLLGEMMEVYSPGYSHKDESKLERARLLIRQEHFKQKIANLIKTQSPALSKIDDACSRLSW
eukprot:gb/GECH01007158.1/.p1 GENE.gb/GECH01007158.1/~~gb/GECH01007158.1/.p1  ORF type:complete len:430 (+),score=135.22 gb/GECH01007158.1/:1-1290(+)